MFTNKINKSTGNLFNKGKSCTLDDRKLLFGNKASEDYVEMSFKPKCLKKTHVFALSPYVKSDSINYVYPIYQGVLKLNVQYCEEPIKQKLETVKVVIEYKDSFLSIDQYISECELRNK